jgi:CRISPR-associated protein Cas5h
VRYSKFRLSGKFGHFLRAEANATGLTYPYPSRTVLLGLLGAVFGLEKDEPQERWSEAEVAVAGVPPKRFWHKSNIRKDGPPLLPRSVRAKDRGSEGSVPRNMRFDQEWLWSPSYEVWVAALPPDDQKQLAARLAERLWHYTPSLGLVSLFAELEWLADGDASRLGHGVHPVRTLARSGSGEVNLSRAADANATVVSLRMPRSASRDRVFGHAGYGFEHEDRPFPFQTVLAWNCDGEAVCFL